MGKANGLPSSVVLGGVTYSVMMAERLAMYDGDLEGDIKYSAARIKIQEGMDPEHTQWIFFHELVHGLSVEGEWQHILGEEGPEKERLITQIGKSLWRFCQDNDLAWVRKQVDPENINSKK